MQGSHQPVAEQALQVWNLCCAKLSSGAVERSTWHVVMSILGIAASAGSVSKALGICYCCTYLQLSADGLNKSFGVAVVQLASSLHLPPVYLFLRERRRHPVSVFYSVVRDVGVHSCARARVRIKPGSGNDMVVNLRRRDET